MGTDVGWASMTKEMRALLTDLRDVLKKHDAHVNYCSVGGTIDICLDRGRDIVECQGYFDADDLAEKLESDNE